VLVVAIIAIRQLFAAGLKPVHHADKRSSA